MGRRGRKLAARFKQAHTEATSEKAAEDAAREARLQEGQRARNELFDDLVDFAGELGFLRCERGDFGVRLYNGDKLLHFEPMGEGDRVKVVFENSEKGQHRLFRIAELGGKWAWSFMRYGREERLLFFDDGLEELAILGLGLERPAQSPNVDADVAAGDDETPSDDEATRERTL